MPGTFTKLIACANVAPRSGFVVLWYRVNQLVSTVRFMRLVRRPIFCAPAAVLRQSAVFVQVHRGRANRLNVSVQECRVALLIEVITGDIGGHPDRGSSWPPGSCSLM